LLPVNLQAESSLRRAWGNSWEAEPHPAGKESHRCLGTVLDVTTSGVEGEQQTFPNTLQYVRTFHIQNNSMTGGETEAGMH
jgi:hypothetical protein